MAPAIPGPGDLATRSLLGHHVVDRALHHRPHLGEEGTVIGDQGVMPQTGRDVCAEVGINRRVLHRAVAVVGVPGAVAPLVPRQPAIGAPGLVDQLAGGEGHRALDNVPRVGVTSAEPGDAAVGELHRGDRRRSVVDRRCRQRGGHIMPPPDPSSPPPRWRWPA